jgi:N-acyl-D-amino-acid deacylase
MKYPILILIALIWSSCKQTKYDVIIRGGTVYDGSGAPGVVTDVAINADTIAAVGDLSKAVAEKTIDATGLTLSPGFIDAHSHHDWGMSKMRDMPACVSQGITTIVVGQDGGSHFPLSDYFKKVEAEPVAVNIASYSGHNTLRDSVINGDFKRFCTPDEIATMKKMLEQDMQAGALGLSTGLEYDPGIFSAPVEVIELAQVAKDNGGKYISHIRSEDRYYWKAISEIINIGAKTGIPVQISHAKLAMRGIHGQSGRLISKLDSARAAGVNITADIYPYTYWQSTMTVMFPERNFKDMKAAQFALTEVTYPEGVLIGNYTPDTTLIGKTLAEIAFMRKTSPAKTLMDMIAEVEKKNGDESVIVTSMAEGDVGAIMKWPHTTICSDGSSGGGHPRGYGAFTRVLHKYVKEDSILTLAEAIHKMTGQTAETLNIKNRGKIKVGAFADLVMFDFEEVSDQSTPKQPHLKSTGIEKVWVNGQEVYAINKSTGIYPGRVIKRGKK